MNYIENYCSTLRTMNGSIIMNYSVNVIIIASYIS